MIIFPQSCRNKICGKIKGIGLLPCARKLAQPIQKGMIDADGEGSVRRNCC